MSELVLQSAAFNNQDLMPDHLSRSGANTSPPLRWSGVPAGTAELVLMCEDPDAPGQPFLHWLVTGVDPATGEVTEGRVPAGARQWRNGFGAAGWGGPQPPVGDKPHRYVFHLYAVREPLELPADPQVADVQRAAGQRQLASGTLVGRFGR